MPRTFEMNGRMADIPDDKVSAFLERFPDAREYQTFIVGKDTVDIPIDNVDKFTERYKDAKPLYPAKEKPGFFEALGESLAPEMKSPLPGDPIAMMYGPYAKPAVELLGNIASAPSRLLYASFGDGSYTENLANKQELGGALLGEEGNPWAKMGLDIIGDPVNYIPGAALAKLGLKGVKAEKAAVKGVKLAEDAAKVEKASATGLMKTIEEARKEIKPAEELNPLIKTIEEARKQPMGLKSSTTPGYNVEKMHPGLKEQLPKIIEEFRADFDTMRGRRLTTKQAINTAVKRAAQYTDDEILNLGRGTTMKSTDLLAARIYTNNRLLETTDKLNNIGLGASKVFLKDIARENKIVLKMYMKVRAIGTETARSLRFMQIPIDDNLISGMQKYVEALKRVDPKSAKKLENILDDVNDPKLRDKVLFWYYNSLLSNPFTDMANITGNTSHFLWEMTSLGLNPRNLKPILQGSFRGLKKGIKEAKAIYDMEKKTASKFAGSVNDLHRYDFKMDSKAGKLFHGILPTTRLAMEDAVFSNAAKEVRLAIGARQIAKQSNLKAGDVLKNIQKIIDDPDFVPKVGNEKTFRELAEYADEYADYITFKTPLKSPIGKGIQNTIWVKPVIPFMRVLANIAKAGYKNTPVGIIKLFGKEAKNMSMFQRQDIVRRALAGTAFYAGIGALMANDKIELTGQGPRNRRYRELWDKMGYKPNHIYWKNKDGSLTGISYQNLNPFNVIFAVMGNWQDQYRFDDLIDDDKTFIENTTVALLGAAATMTDQSFMQGVKRFFDAQNYRDKNYLKDTLTGMVTPNIVGFPKNIKEYVQKSKPRYEADEWFDRIKRRVGLSKGLVPVMSAYGGQKQSGYERFPFFPSKVKSNYVLNLLEKKGLSVSVPSKNTYLGNRKMTTKEFSEYVGKSGEEIMKWIEENSYIFNKLNREQSQKILDSVTRKIRETTKYRIQQGGR